MLCLGFSRKTLKYGLNGVKDHDADNENVGQTALKTKQNTMYVILSYQMARGSSMYSEGLLRYFNVNGITTWELTGTT